ncbi:MAG: hypothetical protein GY804_09225 [Alphaproteobacteria bacterium]|nr:hypothetical protein [Alphaproteobacteria bacterium]
MEPDKLIEELQPNFSAIMNFTLKNYKEDISFSFGAYKGNVNIPIFKAGKKVVSLPFNTFAQSKFKRILKNIRSAAPGSSDSLKWLSQWDENSKSRSALHRLVISKTTDNIYTITIKTVEHPDALVWEILTPGNIEVIDGNSKQARSEVALDAMELVVSSGIPQAMVLSKRKGMPWKNQNGGNNNGASGQGTDSGAGKDIPF